MDILNGPRKVGRPKKKPKTKEEEEISKKKRNKYHREYYKKNIVHNPRIVRPYTKHQRVNIKRQALLQTKQKINKIKSEGKIQGKNEM